MRYALIGAAVFIALLFPACFLASKLDVNAWWFFPASCAIVYIFAVAWFYLSVTIDWSIYKLFKK
jgi:hypothetical protein